MAEGSGSIDRNTLPNPGNVDTAEIVQTREAQQLKTLAQRMCDESRLAMQINGSTDYQINDPLQNYRELKYFVIGDVRPLVRQNLHYPPGVERWTRRGRRVYGVEIAASIDPANGDVMIIRKDDIPPSSDPTDWMVIRGNLLTGVFDQIEIDKVQIITGEDGDIVQLEVPPEASPKNANRGWTRIEAQLSPMYHAIGDITLSRADYHGRGVGPEPHRIQEKLFTTDIFEFHKALREEMVQSGMSESWLDHAPYVARDLGEYALAQRLHA